jgi:hypothetical protein
MEDLSKKLEEMDVAIATADAEGRGLHSSTFQLNLGRF